MSWSLLDYFALTRLYTVLPLALLSYGIGVAAGVPPTRAVVSAVALALAMGGGYAYNDLRDQSRDRVNRPARPLVSGRISERQAQRLVAIAFAGAVILAVSTASLLTIAFIVLLVWCSQLYSDAIKHVTGLKNVFVGAWSGLLPWGASLDSVATMTIVPAVITVGLFVTQKELVADVDHLDGDAAAGVTTIPIVVGRRAALAIVLALNVLSWLLARASGTVPVLSHLTSVAEAVAAVNVISLCVIAVKMTNATVRVYLELQKVFLVGGCIGLFAMLAV